jgi:hypothetical protein
MVSLAEARALMQGEPDRALVAYLGREVQMDALLPDDNLPNAVLLRGLELDASQRHYVATIRTYATCDAAERAWAELTDPDPMMESERQPAFELSTPTNAVRR